MEMEFKIRKVNSKFVPHKIKDDQKVKRLEHCKYIIREARRDEDFLKTIVTGDETWCFQYDPKTKRQSAEWRPHGEGNPKKSRFEKPRIKSILIVFYDSKCIIHKEFVQPGQIVNALYYVGVLKRLPTVLDVFGLNIVIQVAGDCCTIMHLLILQRLFRIYLRKIIFL